MIATLALAGAAAGERRTGMTQRASIHKQLAELAKMTAGLADERLAFEVFLPSGRLAHKKQLRLGTSIAHDRQGCRGVKRTAAAFRDRLRKRGQRFAFACGRGPRLLRRGGGKPVDTQRSQSIGVLNQLACGLLQASLLHLFSPAPSKIENRQSKI